MRATEVCRSVLYVSGCSSCPVSQLNISSVLAGYCSRPHVNRQRLQTIIEWASEIFPGTANKLDVLSLLKIIITEIKKNIATEPVRRFSQLFQLNIKISFRHKNNDHRSAKLSLTSDWSVRILCFLETGY